MKLNTNKTFTQGSRKKIEIKRMRTKLKNIIFDNLGLKNKIENNKTSTKELRTKN
jgi:hypothetical protein